MKPKATFLTVLIVLLSLPAFAQLRQDVISPYEYTGQILNPDPSKNASLSNLFNMQVSHSYTATFSSFGGQYQNLNAFTTSFEMFFSPRLNGRVDVSFLHSPFGGNNLAGMNNGIGNRIMIQNAELNYRINDKSSIHVSFRQNPGFFGGFNNPGRFNRFDRRFGYW